MESPRKRRKRSGRSWLPARRCSAPARAEGWATAGLRGGSRRSVAPRSEPRRRANHSRTSSGTGGDPSRNSSRASETRWRTTRRTFRRSATAIPTGGASAATSASGAEGKGTLRETAPTPPRTGRSEAGAIEAALTTRTSRGRTLAAAVGRPTSTTSDLRVGRR